MPSRVQSETNPGSRPVFPTLQADQGAEVTSRGPSSPRAEGDTRSVCRNNRLTVEFEPCAGDVAQLGERLLCKQGVTGSSPVISTSTLSTE
jgi:hypothetical protein